MNEELIEGVMQAAMQDPDDNLVVEDCIESLKEDLIELLDDFISVLGAALQEVYELSASEALVLDLLEDNDGLRKDGIVLAEPNCELREGVDAGLQVVVLHSQNFPLVVGQNVSDCTC